MTDRRNLIMEKKKFSFDVRWVGFGFCFFVTMHLLPAYLMYQLRFISPALTIVYDVWIFAGIALIAFLIGYISRAVTIVEASIAGVLYAVVLLAAAHQMWGGPIKMSTSIWIYAIFAITTMSAMFGEAIQAMKEKRQAAAEAK